MTQPAFDLLKAAYSLSIGVKALRATVADLETQSDREPLRALDRDRMVFIIEAMAEKVDAVADYLMDAGEAERDKAKSNAA